MFSLLMFLIIGGVAGWLAGKVLRGGGMGLFGNIVVGVIGSYVGGAMLWLLGFEPAWLMGRLISATIGAIVLLYVIDEVKRRSA